MATRVDSRAVLDVIGAEHLLGKGDILFLPPESSRLLRVHGAFATETEINRVVDFWKEQATPEYDQSFLVAPPSDDAEPEGEEAAPGGQDPKNQEGAAIPNAKSLIAILNKRMERFSLQIMAARLQPVDMICWRP